MKNYVIIGGGIAALGCIDGIKKHDRDGKITLICGENVLPYARPLISYYLENKTDFDKMQYRDEEFYKSIDVKKGITAEKIDGKKVILSDGEEIPFDKLLLATGSSPFVPPIPVIVSFFHGALLNFSASGGIALRISSTRKYGTSSFVSYFTSLT